jgi:hypothetical protein
MMVSMLGLVPRLYFVTLSLLFQRIKVLIDGQGGVVRGLDKIL